MWILNIFVCMFEAFIFYDFMNGIVEKRFTKQWIYRVSFITTALLTLGINSLQSAILNLVLVLLLYFVTLFVLYHDNILKMLIYFAFLFVILIGIEFLAGFIFMMSSGTDYVVPLNNLYFKGTVIVIGKLFTYFCTHMAKIFIQRRKIGIKRRFMRLVFLLPIASMLVFGFMFSGFVSENYRQILLWISCLLLITANIIVFYILVRFNDIMEQNQEYELMRLQDEMKEAHYDKMEEVSLRHRQYVHNLRDYLETIGGLASLGKSDDILRVLKEMEVEVNSISDKSFTNNSILNAILCEKEATAQKRGIEMDILVEPAVCLDFMSNSEIIVLIGNLLDNALEASASCTGEKSIRCKLYCTENGFTVLHVENTYEHELKKKHGNHYASTKKDKKNHGLGIKSVEEVVKRYKGTVFMEAEKNCFRTIVTITTKL